MAGTGEFLTTELLPEGCGCGRGGGHRHPRRAKLCRGPGRAAAGPMEPRGGCRGDWLRRHGTSGVHRGARGRRVGDRSRGAEGYRRPRDHQRRATFRWAAAPARRRSMASRTRPTCCSATLPIGRWSSPTAFPITATMTARSSVPSPTIAPPPTIGWSRTG